MFSHFRFKKHLGISLTEMLIAIGLIGTVSGVAITNTMNAGVNNEVNNAKLLAALSSNVEHIFEQQVVENGLIPRELAPSSILQSKLNYKSTSTITSSAALPTGCNASLPVTKFNFADKNQHVFASQQWVQETSREDHSTVCVSRGDESTVSTVYRNGQANTTTIASSHEELANATQNNTATTTISDSSTVISTDGRDVTEFRVRFEDKTTGKELLVPSYTITAKCLNGENFTYSTNVTPEDAAGYFLTNLVGNYENEITWAENELAKAQEEYAVMPEYIRDPYRPEYTFTGLGVTALPATSSGTPWAECYNPNSHVWMGPFQVGGYPTDPGQPCHGMGTMSSVNSIGNGSTITPNKPTYTHNNYYILNPDKPIVSQHITNIRGYQNTLSNAFSIAKSVCTAAGGMHCDSVTSKTYTPPSFKIDKRTKCTVQLSGLSSPSNGAPSVTLTPVNATLTIDLKTTNVAEFKINTTTTGNGANLINAAQTIVEKPIVANTATSLGNILIINPISLANSSCIFSGDCSSQGQGNLNKDSKPRGIYSGSLPPGFMYSTGTTINVNTLLGVQVQSTNLSGLTTVSYYANTNIYGRKIVRAISTNSGSAFLIPPSEANIIEGPTSYSATSSFNPTNTASTTSSTILSGVTGTTNTLINTGGSTLNTVGSITNSSLSNTILYGASTLATTGATLITTGTLNTVGTLTSGGTLHFP